MMFVSYNRDDAEFALRLTEDLRAAGVDCWIDKLSIRPGEQWDIAVEAALSRSSEVLLILSPESVASRQVMDEAAYALEEGKTVIPVMLRSCRVPFRLRRLQYVDFTQSYDAGLSRLRQAIAPVAASTGGTATPVTEWNRPERPRRIYALSAAALAIVVAVAVILWSPWRRGSNQTVGGRVIDAVTLKPVQTAEVTVTTEKARGVSYTDDRGFFAVPIDDPSKSAHVTVKADQYVVLEKQVTIGQESLIELFLTKLKTDPPVPSTTAGTETVRPTDTDTTTTVPHAVVPRPRFPVYVTASLVEQCATRAGDATRETDRKVCVPPNPDVTLGGTRHRRGVIYTQTRCLNRVANAVLRVPEGSRRFTFTVGNYTPGVECGGQRPMNMSVAVDGDVRWTGSANDLVTRSIDLGRARRVTLSGVSIDGDCRCDDAAWGSVRFEK